MKYKQLQKLAYKDLEKEYFRLSKDGHNRSEIASQLIPKAKYKESIKDLFDNFPTRDVKENVGALSHIGFLVAFILPLFSSLGLIFTLLGPKAEAVSVSSLVIHGLVLIGWAFIFPGVLKKHYKQLTLAVAIAVFTLFSFGFLFIKESRDIGEILFVCATQLLAIILFVTARRRWRQWQLPDDIYNLVGKE